MKKKKRRKRARRSSKRAGGYPFRDIILANSYSALGDESYAIIQRCVEETLKDPELRKKIEYYARQILKAIAAKL